MQYVLSFLEGIITFISPCLLPMLPIYISYFAGQEGSKSKALIGSIGFVLGFTIVFICLGAFSASLGTMLLQYQTIVNVVTGGIVIILGLSFIEVIQLPYLQLNHGFKTDKLNFFTSIIFGIVFSVAWTPCVGAFLGSALALASTSGSVIQGITMLFCYSMGLGIPFILSTLFIEQLQSTFSFIKSHYSIITKCSGALLMITGIMMMFGYMNELLALLSF